MIFITVKFAWLLEGRNILGVNEIYYHNLVMVYLGGFNTAICLNQIKN